MDDDFVPLPITLTEIHIQPSDSSDFGSCCSEDDTVSTPSQHADSAVLSPLPFVLELPPRAKKFSLPADLAQDPPQAEQIPSPLKCSYSARSCSEEEIPTFEKLADRTVGTFGFLAGLTIYVGLCCCAFNNRAGEEIADTYERHTLFAWCWPLK